jgi:hypothetical protein
MKGENHYLQLPTLEDGNSIQMALMQVMEALLRDQIDTKVAGLLLYGLQIASSNLQQGANFAQGQSATVAGSYDNFEQDYDLADTDCGLKVTEEEEEPEAKAANEIDRAGAVPAAPEPQRIQKDAGRQGFLVRLRPQNDETQLAEKTKEVACNSCQLPVVSCQQEQPQILRLPLTTFGVAQDDKNQLSVVSSQ